jgi:acetyl-CoA carboxylase biotin carboxyl carrier protein
MAQPPKKQKPAASRPAPARSGALDVDVVEQLAAIAARHDLAEVVVEHAGLRIKVSRHGHGGASPREPRPVVHAAPAIAAPAPPVAAPAAPALAPASNPNAVKSPMVGTVYHRPSPDAKPFVEVGAQVKAGDTVLTIEAMKTFNAIAAPRGGTVVEILVADGQPVEFGEPLLVIE